jgi:hypothetical protein
MLYRVHIAYTFVNTEIYICWQYCLGKSNTNVSRDISDPTPPPTLIHPSDLQREVTASNLRNPEHPDYMEVQSVTSAASRMTDHSAREESRSSNMEPLFDSRLIISTSLLVGDLRSTAWLRSWSLLWLFVFSLAGLSRAGKSDSFQHFWNLWSR